MTEPDPFAKLIAAFDQYGGLLRSLASMLGDYNRSLIEAGIKDPTIRASLLGQVQAKFLRGNDA